MKIIIKAILLLFLSVVTVISCRGFPSTVQTSPTKVIETVGSIASVETQMVGTTVTPTAPLPTTLPSMEPKITATQSDSEEILFWEHAIPLPSNISITEYPLPPDKNPTENDGLFQFVPTQVWPIWKADTSLTPHKSTLKELGYEMNNLQLYRDGRLLLDHVTHVSDIYTFSTDSGTVTAFLVQVDLGRENYLIQNDAISTWGEYAIYDSDPILCQGELLWVRTFSDHIEVKRSSGDVIFSFETSWIPNHHPSLIAWNGHWVLEVYSSIIQDGQVLNHKLSFQEMFDWGLVKGKPIYFFRKGAKVGISYDEQILPIQYDVAAHGLCCGPAQNNPSILNDAVHFFAKRDGVWYYVVMKFK